MKVKEIIIRAMKFVGREDVAAKVETDAALETEEAQELETMLYCYNAVEDELARGCLPLVFEEERAKAQGKFEFVYFTFKPVKILSVTAGGKEIKYEQSPSYLSADADLIRVKYEYSPEKKTLSDDCAFGDVKTDVRMLAAGAASEYSLINGEMKQAEFWENEYRRGIELIKRKKLAKAHFPSRRWV